MEQLAIVARLKPGAEGPAGDLILSGPPFDVAESGLDRHEVYLSTGEVVFVFAGREVEWIVDRLIDEPFHWLVNEALERWRPLLDGQPRIARSAYAWTREAVNAPSLAPTA